MNVEKTKDKKTLSPAMTPKNVVVVGSNEKIPEFQMREKNEDEMLLKCQGYKNSIPGNGIEKF